MKEFVISTWRKRRLFTVSPCLPTRPEASPHEQVWTTVENQCAGPAAPLSKAELKSLLFSAVFAHQKLPRKIMSFFEHPETRYALGEAQ